MLLHFSDVMSDTMQVTPCMGLIGARSMAMILEPEGMFFCATCDQPPGAAHRSKHTFDWLKKSNFFAS